jgi:hypothetical protein
MPELRNDVLLGDAAMARGGTSRNTTINVGREPMAEVLRQAHFRRLDVAPLIALAEKAGQLLLRLALRAAERRIFGDASPGQRIPAEIEFQLPRSLALLANMTLRHASKPPLTVRQICGSPSMPLSEGGEPARVGTIFCLAPAARLAPDQKRMPALFAAEQPSVGYRVLRELEP